MSGINLHSFRSKDVEWVPFLTVKMVDDFAAHLKLFGLATEQCEKQREEGIFSFISKLTSAFSRQHQPCML